MPMSIALGRLEYEDYHEVEASLAWIVSSRASENENSKNKNKNRKGNEQTAWNECGSSMFSDGERPLKHVTVKQITDHILGYKAKFLDDRACFLWLKCSKT